jgi:hypothetical protein
MIEHPDAALPSDYRLPQCFPVGAIMVCLKRMANVSKNHDVYGKNKRATY